ncbi:paramyosin, short form-like [Cotesia typhae]|uniref:paramyosin, short form-like n=1 Tax=Cotesia typhae TaxID=2053667 RepID=UPI003D690A31
MAKILLAILALTLLIGIVACYNAEDVESDWFGRHKYKRQIQEQEGMSQQSVTRVRRSQRELEPAEDRADIAESNLSPIRAKHRSFVTTSTVPESQVYLVQELRA